MLLCDIEAASTQIRLCAEYKDLCRFLWVKDTNDLCNKSNVIEYRFKRLPFGVTASPSILNMAILAYLSTQNTSLADEIAKNLYVDNILIMTETEKDALQKYKESKQLFANIGMNLREYVTNSHQVNAGIPEIDRTPTGEIKILGVPYNTDTDRFTIRTSFPRRKILTKRDIISQINSIYDPLGFASPLLVKLKGIMREAYDTKMDWKETLPAELTKRWNGICDEVNNAIISIPRRPDPRNLGELECESPVLWVFGDASQQAIATCAYLQYCTTNWVSNLICGKTKLTPKEHPQTIPRLELLSTLISLRFALTIQKSMTSLVKKVNIVSDSEIALHWLKSSRTLPVFVTNQKDRIVKIKSQIEAQNVPVTLLHVTSDYNPADCGTRGLTASKINSSSWIQGPQWLRNKNDKWPLKSMGNIEENLSKDVPHGNGKTIIAPVISETQPSEERNEIMDLTRFSKLGRALRTIARVAKLLQRWVRQTNEHRHTDIRLMVINNFTTDPEITAEEIAASEVIILWGRLSATT
ncbi:hypothetical protein Y032_0784g2335 [Ancylostoma ceylanicum]|uniref:Reverse transcriptase domain-containing protein n=1 Tax=Ancylostoma ceylanicum TaxID=53326 RepID=A0A016WE01_9BILA|nr:hypothetical protein Y032_0784g2335 [Ancylostoma ceylanicum]